MTKPTSSILMAAGVFAAMHSAAFAAKPLRIFILAGQSNMQGQAQPSTIPRMALSPETKALHDKMLDENGQPRVHKNVSIVYFTGGDAGKGGVERPQQVCQGPLAAGVVGAIGPDIAFGLTMGESKDEPILLIKTAWGGRDLRQQFRSPSAGPFRKDKDKFGNPTGHYYNRIVQCVKEVIADPGKYHPAYDKAAGYEIAGFVWFQGYNDMIAGREDMYEATKDRPQFAAYTDILGCLIRDLRKEFNVPKMPCVVGVVGFGGVKENDPFRNAQAAVAALPEFKGTVAAVETAGFWDNEMVAALERLSKADALFDKSDKWSAVGAPGLKDRIWHYTSFMLDPEKHYPKEEDGEEKQMGADRTFTSETPAELKDWLNPAFDTSRWQKGPAPIVKGEKPVKKSGKKKDAPQEKAVVSTGSPWGEGNILLMKTTFTVNKAGFSNFRLCYQSTSSFHMYLNGKLIKDYPWWDVGDEIRRSDVDAAYVKDGINELAFYGNDEANKKTDVFNSVDAYLEGLPAAAAEEIKKQQNEISSARDRELAKGKSNADYHYLGSAYTYSRIGESMAKAMKGMLKP